MSNMSLGYIGLETTKLEQWRRYCCEFLGLMDVSESAPEQPELRFRMDNQAWRIAITEGPSEDLSFAGFDMANRSNMDRALEQLAAAGIEINENETLAKHRGVQSLYLVQDPDGLQLELYLGKLDAGQDRFVSPVGIKQFVTGDQGLGHIVLFTASIEQKLTFYIELLGFSLSDTISLAGGKFNLKFLHCNPRHHSLALVPVANEKHLNHFMLQVDDLNDVGLALDRTDALDIKITSSLGCHSNDKMVSFYATTPSGFDLEFGYGARTIDAQWQEGYHQVTSIWGHKQNAKG